MVEGSGLFIPTEPEMITAEWLFAVLNQYRQSRNLSLLKQPNDILSCNIKERIEGRQYLSNSFLLIVTFNVYTSMGLEKVTETLFAKMIPIGSDHFKSLVCETKLFYKEVEANYHYIPYLKKFVQEKKSINLSIFKEEFTPDKVFGSYDNIDGSGVIVSLHEHQDYKGTGGFDVQQVLSVVESMAEFHGAGAALIHEEGPELKEFSFLNEDRYFDYEIVYSETAPIIKAYSRFLKRVPGFIDTHLRFESLRHLVWKVLATSCTDRRLNTNSPLKTIIHGELCDRNLILRKVNNDWKVKFADWKNCGISSPSMDLAFFLLTSTTHETRTKHLRQILEKYYFNYSETLRKFGLNINNNDKLNNCTFETFLADFEQSLLGCFFQSVIFMIREVTYLESEFNSKSTPMEKKEIIGEELRIYGRRLIEISDEFIPKLSSITWKNQMEL